MPETKEERRARLDALKARRPLVADRIRVDEPIPPRLEVWIGPEQFNRSVLHQLMGLHALSTAQLAELLCVKPSTVRHYLEYNDQRTPQRTTLMVIEHMVQYTNDVMGRYGGFVPPRYRLINLITSEEWKAQRDAQAEEALSTITHGLRRAAAEDAVRRSLLGERR